ncbi:hypothetical protein RRF57_011748 [Xylaria bambusicola]|uniref:Uncharacterized protein n=1 Tax=Xylaria bambusicola TaxID=326684 RepID=A0AAN7ZDB3_9PEZI
MSPSNSTAIIPPTRKPATIPGPFDLTFCGEAADGVGLHQKHQGFSLIPQDGFEGRVNLGVDSTAQGNVDNCLVLEAAQGRDVGWEHGVGDVVLYRFDRCTPGVAVLKLEVAGHGVEVLSENDI